MDQVAIWYFGIGVVVSLIYFVNSRIRLISGPSINDRLVVLRMATCPLRGHWALPVVTGVALALVAAGDVIGWPYALFVNIQRWCRYKPPMSEDEIKLKSCELRQNLENTLPMSPEEMEAERKKLRQMIAIHNRQKL